MKDVSFLWTEDQSQELLRDFPYGPVLNGRLDHCFYAIILHACSSHRQ